MKKLTVIFKSYKNSEDYDFELTSRCKTTEDIQCVQQAIWDYLAKKITEMSQNEGCK